jgi:hypothetical protein
MADALATVLDPDNEQLKAYRQQAPELLTLATELEITTDDGLAVAAEHTKASTTACRAIKAMFKPAKDSLTDAKRQIDRLEKSLLDGFEKADALLRGKVAAYHARRRREAEEEQRRLQEAARKQREEEQLAQAVRLEDMARVTGEDHYRRAADLTLNQPVRTPTVVVKPPTVKGITHRVERDVDVLDKEALIAAVAAGKVATAALLPNQAWLRNEAKQLGTAVKAGDELFPGVVVVERDDVTVRTR